MNILVISRNYPSKQNPYNGIFLYRLVQKFIERGHRVIVISPLKMSHLFKKSYDYGKESALVLRPLAVSFSAIRIWKYNSFLLTHWMQKLAVRIALKKQMPDFDIVYCQFLQNAFAAVEALKGFSQPVFVDVGEYKGIDNINKWFGKHKFSILIESIRGFVVVSEQIAQKLKGFNVPDEKIMLAPNGIDRNHFRKLNKSQLRIKYNLPLNRILIAFTGNFIESKGPHRLLQAIQGYENIGVIFMGSGPIKLTGNQVDYKQKVPGYLVSELLNCADFFVLPTQHEGSNNSIIEAMACGLPIISSDIPEVRSQCDPSFAILVDPMNIQEIRQAILKLANDAELREQMSANAIEWSKKFDLDHRADKILNFLESNIKEK